MFIFPVEGVFVSDTAFKLKRVSCQTSFQNIIKLQKTIQRIYLAESSLPSPALSNRLMFIGAAKRPDQPPLSDHQDGWTEQEVGGRAATAGVAGRVITSPCRWGDVEHGWTLSTSRYIGVYSYFLNINLHVLI